MFLLYVKKILRLKSENTTVVVYLKLCIKIKSKTFSINESKLISKRRKSLKRITLAKKE